MFKYMTQVVHFWTGANILGLLDFFAFLGVMTGSSIYLSEMFEYGAPVGLVVGVFSIAGFDYLIRSCRPQSTGRSRFLTLTDGGCLCCLPVWLFFPVSILLITVIAIALNVLRA